MGRLNLCNKKRETNPTTQPPSPTASPESFQKPDKVGHDVFALRDGVGASVHEDGRAEVHPGEPLGLRGGDEPILDRPDVQARQLLLGLVLPQRVARNLSRGKRQEASETGASRWRRGEGAKRWTRGGGYKVEEGGEACLLDRARGVRSGREARVPCEAETGRLVDVAGERRERRTAAGARRQERRTGSYLARSPKTAKSTGEHKQNGRKTRYSRGQLVCWSASESLERKAQQQHVTPGNSLKAEAERVQPHTHRTETCMSRHRTMRLTMVGGYEGEGRAAQQYQYQYKYQ